MEDQGTFWLPPQASTTAHEIDWLFNFILWTSVVILAGVTFFMVYYAWKYRRRSHADRPVDVHPSHWLELSWVVIPSLLVLVVFWFGFRAFVSAGISPDNAYEIRVVGKKWLWEFEYPNGTTSVGDLYVPVGEPVELVMTSTDVIHSFFIPAFRVKHDAVPNRYATVWFEVKEPGEYQVLCTEYCGTSHSEMYAKVIAVERGEFNEWLRTGGGGEDLPLPRLGEELYTQQACNTCHSLDGSPKVGPSWLGYWGEERPLADGTSAVYDANYVVESIVQPQAKIAAGFANAAMPAYPNLSERQLAGIVAYIREINGDWSEEDAAAAEGGAAADTTGAPADSLAAPAEEAPAEEPAVE
jgi:cytochrome c oxidase subunit 2